MGYKELFRIGKLISILNEYIYWTQKPFTYNFIRSKINQEQRYTCRFRFNSVQKGVVGVLQIRSALEEYVYRSAIIHSLIIRSTSLHFLSL